MKHKVSELEGDLLNESLANLKAAFERSVEAGLSLSSSIQRLREACEAWERQQISMAMQIPPKKT